jgi:hypothetical protein
VTEVSADSIGGHASQPVAGPSSAPTASAHRTPPSASTVPPAAHVDGRTELRQRRDALAEEVTELHWDLGGLAYEMAIRDHFRLDVLVRRAALLQERDAELAEVERLLAMEDTASIGDCPQCGAPHSRGAVFCWQCGVALMERSAPLATGTAGLGAASAGVHGATGRHETPDGQTLAADSNSITSGASAARPGGGDSAADEATAVMDRLLAPSAPSRDGASAAGASSPAGASTGWPSSSAPSSTPER